MAEVNKSPFPQIITQGESTLKPKPWDRKKLILLTVAICVVATAVCVTIYFVTKTNVDLAKEYTIHFRDEYNNLLNQTIRNDESQNTQLFHVRTTTNVQWILKDFNRDIDVYKFEEGGRSICYVSPLNTSRELEPNHIDEALSTHATGDDADHRHYYQYHTHGKPIVKPSFLGPAAMKLCDDIDTYWLYPTCPTAGSGLRRKRSADGSYGHEGEHTVVITRVRQGLYGGCCFICLFCCC